MMEFFDLFREDRWPHMFCPGCGIGTVMNCFHRAFAEVGMDQDRTVFVSGIGCSSRIIGYIRADSIHTAHGRALAVATGIKLANPDLNVIVFSGDGDIGAIGGNHFINAARRNVDMAVFCINNFTYGMTGGQVSTTTPYHSFSTTTPYGSGEYPFRPLRAGGGGRRQFRGPLDREECQGADRFHGEGHDQERLLFRRDSLALPHLLRAQESHGRAEADVRMVEDSLRAAGEEQGMGTGPVGPEPWGSDHDRRVRGEEPSAFRHDRLISMDGDLRGISTRG